MMCFKVGGGFQATMTAIYSKVKGGLWRQQKFLKMLALVGLVSACGLALSSCATVVRVTLGNIPEIGQDFRDMAARMELKKRASLDPDSGLAANLAWVSHFAEDGGNYVFEISENQSVTCVSFRYTDTSNVTITIRGIGENITISPNPECHQFINVSAGATLILDNITVRGFPDHPTNTYPPLIRVYRNGTLEMLDGSAIIANTSKINSSGAAVSVSHGGTFHMKGGIISGNSSFMRYNPLVPDEETGGNGYGGGVEVAGGGTVVGAGGAGSSTHALGTFIKTGGIITGYADDPENGNAVRDPNGNPVSGRGHALYIGHHSGEGDDNHIFDETIGPEVQISFVNGELTLETAEGAVQSVTAAVSQAVASRVDNSQTQAQTQVAPPSVGNQPIALAFYVFGHRDPSANRFLGTDMTRALAQMACYREAPRYEEFLTAAANESRRQQLPESRIITLARNHGIQQIGIASMQQVIDSYYISVKIVNVETGETIASAELDNSLASLAEIRTASESITGRFTNLCQ